MRKSKTILKDEKIEIVNIYKNDGQQFEEVLANAIKKLKIRKQIVIKQNSKTEVKKEETST